MDVRGAFDNVSRTRLLNTMHQLGIPAQVRNWAGHFLSTDRQLWTSMANKNRSNRSRQGSHRAHRRRSSFSCSTSGHYSATPLNGVAQSASHRTTCIASTSAQKTRGGGTGTAPYPPVSHSVPGLSESSHTSMSRSTMAPLQSSTPWRTVPPGRIPQFRPELARRQRRRKLKSTSNRPPSSPSTIGICSPTPATAPC